MGNGMGGFLALALLCIEVLLGGFFFIKSTRGMYGHGVYPLSMFSLSSLSESRDCLLCACMLRGVCGEWTLCLENVWA